MILLTSWSPALGAPPGAAFRSSVPVCLPAFLSFSRSSASMRAIPLAKQLAKIAEEGAARPALFRSKQKGMQGGEEVANVEDVISLWESAAEDAATWAQALDDLGVHKAIPNRLLEPFIMQTQIITSVNWQNFFDQRCSPLAEDNIRIPAEMMRDALAASTPKQLVRGDWHLPYVDDDDITYAWDHFGSFGRRHVYLWLARLSAARHPVPGEPPAWRPVGAQRQGRRAPVGRPHRPGQDRQVGRLAPAAVDRGGQPRAGHLPLGCSQANLECATFFSRGRSRVSIPPRR